MQIPSTLMAVLLLFAALYICTSRWHSFRRSLAASSHTRRSSFLDRTLSPRRRSAMTVPDVPMRIASVCVTLDRDDNPGWCKRRRLWSTADYEATRTLGKGAFGAVVEARHLATGHPVAVKELSSATRAEEAVQEAEFLAACRGHPSLVDLHALAMDPHTGEVALVMECVGPNLHDVLNSGRYRGGVPFPEADVRRIMRQLLEGTKHMHARKVMHRDIKPGNVLVRCQDPVSVKICDLGLAASIAAAPPYERAGTRRYTAPEMLLGKLDYDAMVDMWSLGCVMAELLTGKPLFDGDSDADVLLRIFSVLGVPGQRTWPGFKSLPLAGTVVVPRVRHRSRLRQMVTVDRLSADGYDVLKRLLSCDADKRPSATAALRSPWFTKDTDCPSSTASVSFAAAVAMVVQ